MITHPEIARAIAAQRQAALAHQAHDARRARRLLRAQAASSRRRRPA